MFFLFFNIDHYSWLLFYCFLGNSPGILLVIFYYHVMLITIRYIISFWCSAQRFIVCVLKRAPTEWSTGCYTQSDVILIDFNIFQVFIFPNYIAVGLKKKISVRSWVYFIIEIFIAFLKRQKKYCILPIYNHVSL